MIVLKVLAFSLHFPCAQNQDTGDLTPGAFLYVLSPAMDDGLRVLMLLRRTL